MDSGCGRCGMLALLLLPLLWAGSLQVNPGYELKVAESVTVQEGLCILVHCHFSYPWPRRNYYTSSPPYIYWFLDGDTIYDEPVATNNQNREVKTETRDRFHLVQDIRNNNCSLHITDARKGDSGHYVFRVERGSDVKYTYRDKKLTLRVTALTEKPVIHFLEPLQSGRLSQLRCSVPGSCQGSTSLTFSWRGNVIKMMDPSTLQTSELSLSPRPQDHNTSLTCQVNLHDVTTERTIWLNVSYAPQNLSISHLRNGTGPKMLQNTSLLTIQEGHALQLQCVVDSNPPAKLSWFRGSSTLNSSISNSGILKLSPSRIEDEGKITCHAQNALGNQTVSLNLSVLYDLQLLGPSCSWDAEDLHCNCSSRAWPPPSLHWRLGEVLLEGNSSNASFTVTSNSAGPWANSSLRLHRELSPGMKLHCEAQNVRRAHSVTVLLLPGKSVSRPGSLQVLSALGGAGTMALLCLCMCLIFICIVKVHRHQAAVRSKGMDDEDPVMDSVPWGSRQESWPDSQGDQASSTGDALPLGEQQDLHYASLSFHGIKPQELQDMKATSTTEYSEIKINK
ncbi:sialic acid-binding Ig-like lectin 5 isoform X2 [Castor canadensis]|uniref:Sialic acid-binding Ig-like lectin 5 isoform X1 n=1 Tax=Castor canadensis TaxID=51338 RepID=A0A8B7V055_CASCN|nr:sialic acid-binding Ig-like lectin 5 isoform X1 [Castor canadensis]